jgi:DNA modification methylase
MKIEKIAIELLNPATYNPRKDLKPEDLEYQKIKASINEFGYIDPIIWNKQTGNIISGHQRFKVLFQLGYNEVDCVVVDFDSITEKKANLALNKISGEWDEEKLSQLLNELRIDDVDFSSTGFSEKEIEKLISEVFKSEFSEDNFDIDAEIEQILQPLTQKGDIWLIGRHRLMCGDSTSKKDVATLMNGQLADMIFTDPPYNVNYEGRAGKIQNDCMPENKFYNFILDAYTSMFSSVKDGGAIYVCHSESEGVAFRKALTESGFLLKQCLIWVKNMFVIGRQDYQWQHEAILYGWKPGASHKWYGGRKQSTVIQPDDGVFVNKIDDGYQLTFNNGVKSITIVVPEYEVISDSSIDDKTIWNIDKPLKNGEHPTMKPILLCAKAIFNSSKIGDIVLDEFGGSGSTLMACEQAERICYTMELEEKFCDVIVKRYIKYKGNDDEVFLIRNGEKLKIEM